MAYTTINKSSDYFNTKLYTGNGSARSITGVGFQPDWLWIKQRSDTENHQLFDAVRGVGKAIITNGSSTESSTSYQSSFDSDGFSINNASEVNQNSQTYASWNWKANGQGSSNTAGSINTTYTSVNTTAGFSISKYSGNTTAGATIGHGLGAVPKMVIIKNLNSSENWVVYHASLGATKFLNLNSSSAESTSSGVFNNTAPTSSLIYLGDFGSVNESPGIYVAYAFAEKQGYSKFGSYTGNGNADGTFVYTGFKPAFVMVKSSSHAINWSMIDNTRDPDNAGTTAVLRPNKNDTEDDNSAYNVELLSNGFKNRNTNSSFNNPSYEYIYMAFAEAPLVGTNNVPCTAR